MFIINVIDMYSRIYRTYDIRENLKLGFVVKVVAGLRDGGSLSRVGSFKNRKIAFSRKRILVYPLYKSI